MLKYLILFLSLILALPTWTFSSKNELDQNVLPQVKLQNTEILYKEIREISVDFSSRTTKLLKLKKEMERLERSIDNVDEIFYLREVVYAISVTTVSAAYQRLMLYQYPDLNSENNIHTTTLIMFLRTTKEQLMGLYSKLRMAQDMLIKNEDFNDILDKCLSEFYLMGDLTKRSMEIMVLPGLAYLMVEKKWTIRLSSLLFAKTSMKGSPHVHQPLISRFRYPWLSACQHPISEWGSGVQDTSKKNRPLLPPLCSTADYS